MRRHPMPKLLPLALVRKQTQEDEDRINGVQKLRAVASQAGYHVTAEDADYVRCKVLEEEGLHVMDLSARDALSLLQKHLVEIDGPDSMGECSTEDLLDWDVGLLTETVMELRQRVADLEARLEQ